MKSPYPFQILLLETVRKRERAAMLSVYIYIYLYKCDHCCFTFFMFGHILQQPLYFDILIHCPGQPICDKVARWPRSKKTAV